MYAAMTEDAAQRRRWTFYEAVNLCRAEKELRMRNKRYGGYKRPDSSKIDRNKSAEDIVRELKKLSYPPSSYRERSLEIHGLICAKCGREFDYQNKHLLTVHHKDGNHNNNPPDGSNWENLCIYCHEDEHSRGLLGDYFGDKR